MSITICRSQAPGLPRARTSRYYTGPKSDHFDGERFFDPQGAPPRSRRDLLRWHIDRRWRAPKAKWPVWAPSPYVDRPPTRVEGTALRISYVGHASMLIQTAGLNILLDPVWSKRASPFHFAGPKRVNNPGIVFADLPPIDVVLVSHGHYDHLDLATLSRLAAVHHPRGTSIDAVGGELTQAANVIWCCRAIMPSS